MRSRMTRRSWAATLAAAPAALAQTRTPQPPPQTAEQWLDTQRNRLQRNLEQLRKFRLEQVVEPCTRFEA
jgi:hypothetical protein